MTSAPRAGPPGGSGRPDPTTFLPLSAATYGILLILTDRTLHGYGIMREFEERTGQEDVLLPSSLYNTLSRMLSSGLVEEVPGDGTDPRRSRSYTATALGRSVARAETRRLSALLRVARDKGLAESPGG